MVRNMYIQYADVPKAQENRTTEYPLWCDALPLVSVQSYHGRNPPVPEPRTLDLGGGVFYRSATGG